MPILGEILDRLIRVIERWRDAETSGRTDEPADPPAPAIEPPASTPEPPAAPSPMAPAARIGPRIRIEGEITGDEDLRIEGRFRGSVELRSHTVTVGPEADVNATIVGRSVAVEGTVRGDITAEAQIVLLGSADVVGELRSPRVLLEDGAEFRGGVDMGDAAPVAGSHNPASQSTGESTGGTRETRLRELEGRPSRTTLISS